MGRLVALPPLARHRTRYLVRLLRRPPHGGRRPAPSPLLARQPPRPPAPVQRPPRLARIPAFLRRTVAPHPAALAPRLPFGAGPLRPVHSRMRGAARLPGALHHHRRREPARSPETADGTGLRRAPPPALRPGGGRGQLLGMRTGPPARRRGLRRRGVPAARRRPDPSRGGNQSEQPRHAAHPLRYRRPGDARLGSLPLRPPGPHRGAHRRPRRGLPHPARRPPRRPRQPLLQATGKRPRGPDRLPARRGRHTAHRAHRPVR
jgi:hypothetical protein